MNWTDRIGRRVKLRDLHILLAVMQSGSMGKAALHLSLSQPAISKAVADLEGALGVRLLDRTRSGVEPTLYGRTLLKWGMAAFDDLRQGVKELESLADPGAGELRIGCTEPLAAGFVATIVDQLSRRHSRATFRVVPADRVALLETELRQRKVELAVTATQGLDIGADVQVDPLFDDVHVVIAGTKNKWLRRRGVRMTELLKEPWVLPPPESSAGTSIREAFRAARVEPPRASVATYSIPLVCNLLATGRYLTMLPISMLQLAPQVALRVVPVTSPMDHRPVAILTLRNRTLGTLAQLFIDSARSAASHIR